MLGLPSTTEINMIFPKESFYQQLEIHTKVRLEFTDLIERIRAVNTVKQTTAHVTDGKQVKEIIIFFITLKGETLPQQALTVIAQLPGRFLIFVTQTATGHVSTSVLRRGKLYTVSREANLDLSAENLDQIWDNFCSTLVFGTLTFGSVDDRIDAVRKEKQLTAELAETTRKINQCRQMRRRNALFTQYGKIRNELESVQAQLERLEGKTEER